MQDFKKYFDKELLPILEELEQERPMSIKNKKKSIWIVWIVFIASFPILGNLAAKFESIVLMFLPILLFVIALGYTLILRYKSESKSLNSKFKQRLIPKILSTINEGLTYDLDSMVPVEEYFSGMVNHRHFTHYYGEDFVKGSIGDVNIMFSEVATRNNWSIGRRSSEINGMDIMSPNDLNKVKVISGIPFFKRRQAGSFHGFFVVLDFNKEFRSQVYISSFPIKIVKGESLATEEEVARLYGHKIILESAEFNRKFEVRCNDQVEARYVLSTSLMQRILTFRKNTYLNLKFLNSKLYVTLPAREYMFEPKFWKPVTDYSMVEGYFNYLNLLVSLVEELNLNTKIWSKE